MSMITVNGEVYWLWVAYEPYIKRYLLMHIYKERTLTVCYNFIKLRGLYGNRYTLCTDGAYYYNQAYRWLMIKHNAYDQEDKNIMVRSIQHINKDRML